MIKVFIADDHVMVRKGLKSILSEDEEIAVIGEASDGDETLRKIRTCITDVLLLDLSMPGPGFIELIKCINRLSDPAKPKKILILSFYPEEQYAFRALKAGADGYLTKEHTPDELIAAIKKLYKGGRYVSQAMAENMLEFVLDKNKQESAMHEQLSDREYEIFTMLGQGISIKQISESLSLSSKTISTYRARLMKKMKMKTNADIIRYVIENRLD